MPVRARWSQGQRWPRRDHDAVGIERIERREAQMTRAAFVRWGADPRIEILGNPYPARRVGIVSFNSSPPKASISTRAS